MSNNFNCKGKHPAPLFSLQSEMPSNKSLALFFIFKFYYSKGKSVFLLLTHRREVDKKKASKQFFYKNWKQSKKIHL